ncbi:MAG: metal ABC transporter permease [Alphaproteobacteria bacterium]
MSGFWAIDFPPLVAAILASLACALVGNLLILTRQAMAADALSHALVPGIVIGAMVTGSAAAPIMLASGLGAALASTGLTRFLVRVGRVEPGAALGVVFTGFFAFGILLLEAGGLARTAFDIHHVVTGNLEGLVWIHDARGVPLFDGAALALLPPQLAMLALVLVLVAAILAGLYKELTLTAFDPVFARATGLPVGRLDLALVVATALACIAAFQSVGVVLAAAMVVCPPATARLLTERLPIQIALSAIIAIAVVLVGYGLAVLGPQLFGSAIALSAAGMIGATAGVTLAVTAALKRG